MSNKPTTTDKPTIEFRERPTIMDGKVVTFALGFHQEHRQPSGIESWRATGPFEVSASRNRVLIHRAEFSDEESMELLIEAIRMAEARRKALR